MLSLPITRELVLIGGGHTHALILKRWGMRPLAGVRVTVIDPRPVAAYSGMLPGFVAGHYSREDLEIDLMRLARFAGARVIVGAVTGIDRAAKRIEIEGRSPVCYDVASIDIGITSAMPDLAGFTEHATPAKPLDAFAARWASFRQRALSGVVAPKVAVIGGGVAGAELAMAAANALVSLPDTHVHLLDQDGILAELHPKTREVLLSRLSALNVSLHPGAEIARIEDDAVILVDGTQIESRFTLGAAGARPYGWLAETGLELNRGFVTVGPTLQSSDASIFAAGDCAHLAHAPRPKAGVYAVRAAPTLFRNLRIALSGKRGEEHMHSYRPQRDYLKLISLGEKSAVGDRNGLRFSGPLMWRWKDRIDRKFMDKLKDLAPMQGPDIPSQVADGVREELAGKSILCGACGAKVGGSVLRDVLAKSHVAPRDDIKRVAGDDAAMIRCGDKWQTVSVDHLRAFVDDPALMARITAIHALGDIWAMGAQPQAALATITLPRLSPRLQNAWLAEIMDAAGQVIEGAGARIIGGHTAMGAELSIGFTVTGLTDAPITLQGAHQGDLLILTKPIGTGVILAAEMALAARGVDVLKSYQSMSLSSAKASELLRGSHAMTDVTGFGLAGHLSGMCRASGVGATLDLGAIPLLSGALELAETGVRSTIWEANRAYADIADLPPSPQTDLLFDPQTAGGLLAALPEKDAAVTLSKLIDAGYQAAIIGHVTNDPSCSIRLEH